MIAYDRSARHAIRQELRRETWRCFGSAAAGTGRNSARCACHPSDLQNIAFGNGNGNRTLAPRKCGAQSEGNHEMRPLFGIYTNRYFYRCGNCGGTWWGTGGSCPSCGSGDVHTRNPLLIVGLATLVLMLALLPTIAQAQASLPPNTEPIIGPGPCHSDTPWGCYEFQVWMPVIGGGS